MALELFLNCILLFSLSVQFALSMAAPEDIPEVITSPGGDCTLPCPTVFKPGIQYLSLSWYKAIEPSSNRLNGILMRELPNGTTLWYRGVEREVELLGDSPDVFIPNVTCSDRGLYTCALAAPVGEQNREKRIRLVVSGCPDESEPETEELIKDTYLVVFAALLLIFALLIFKISYGCLKNTLKGNKPTKRETLIDPRLKPLDKKDLMMIATLGPKPSKTNAMKFDYV